MTTTDRTYSHLRAQPSTVDGPQLLKDLDTLSADDMEGRLPGTAGGAKAPTGDLKAAIDGAFGDLDKMKAAVKQAGMTRFGSGWAWLAVGKDKKLTAFNTPYQDTPHMDMGAKPILGIDVWEHAYYLKHQYRRPAYIDIWWNTVNWDKAAANFKKATA